MFVLTVQEAETKKKTTLRKALNITQKQKTLDEKNPESNEALSLSSCTASSFSKCEGEVGKYEEASPCVNFSKQTSFSSVRTKLIIWQRIKRIPFVSI